MCICSREVVLISAKHRCLDLAKNIVQASNTPGVGCKTTAKRVKNRCSRLDPSVVDNLAMHEKKTYNSEHRPRDGADTS